MPTKFNIKASVLICQTTPISRRARNNNHDASSASLGSLLLRLV